MPQVQLHPSALSPELTEALNRHMQKLHKDIESQLINNPELGKCWFASMGRIMKESKDVQDAVCNNKPWQGGHELYELAVVSSAISVKNDFKPVLNIY